MIGLGANPTDFVPEGVSDRIESLGHMLAEVAARQQELADLAGVGGPLPQSRTSIVQGYIGVFVIAFIVTLLATPLMRKLATTHGIVDMPTDPRKVHRRPTAYLGGVAVFLGLMGGIFYSIIAAMRPGLIEFHATTFLVDATHHALVPISVLLGITVIMIVGLLDDVIGISPRVKIGGQLLAAAALAYQQVGVNLARGVLAPIGSLIGNADLTFVINLPFQLPLGMGNMLTLDLIYWTGTAIIGIFVLGACNASNLIDGLDGLLSGTTAIMAAGLLVVALSLAIADDGPRDAQRIVLCLALLGACVGFLPHNFNPATIFLGDCGSLLLGFTTIVIILTLGDTGKTHLVFAGLLIYAIPIIDTVLAIVRRKLAGKSISDPDDQHLHHMLKRSLGVKGAVLMLYAIGVGFAILGVAISLGRARVVYVLALVFTAYIIVTAIKVARKSTIEADMLSRHRVEPPAPSAAEDPEPGEKPTGAYGRAEPEPAPAAQ